MPENSRISGKSQVYLLVGIDLSIAFFRRVPSLEIQNLKFLQDFWAHEVPPHPEQEALALAHIQTYPGIPLAELLAIYPDLAVDVIWVLLSTRRVFTDLPATLLMRILSPRHI